MGNSIFAALESLVLVTALSVDAFVASFAYGANKIKIPFRSVAVITLVCSAILAVSLSLGSLVRPYVPAHLAGVVCFVILFLLGIVKLCDSALKSMIRKSRGLHKKISFSALHLDFILDVYANPENADCDCSKTLSPAEAAPLAVALSLDGLAVGFGAAIASVDPVQAVIFSLAANIIAVG
ncbi:sporulation membrane protein YtaF, partial [Blautia wexlerae]|nr:sporulation membrane protein YtaF [Blautia wexlerae]